MESVEKVREELNPDLRLAVNAALEDVRVTPVTPEDPQDSLRRSVGVTGTTLFTVDI